MKCPSRQLIRFSSLILATSLISACADQAFQAHKTTKEDIARYKALQAKANPGGGGNGSGDVRNPFIIPLPRVSGGSQSDATSGALPGGGGAGSGDLSGSRLPVPLSDQPLVPVRPAENRQAGADQANKEQAKNLAELKKIVDEVVGLVEKNENNLQIAEVIKAMDVKLTPVTSGSQPSLNVNVDFLINGTKVIVASGSAKFQADDFYTNKENKISFTEKSKLNAFQFSAKDIDGNDVQDIGKTIQVWGICGETQCENLQLFGIIETQKSDINAASRGAAEDASVGPVTPQNKVAEKVKLGFLITLNSKGEFINSSFTKEGVKLLGVKETQDKMASAAQPAARAAGSDVGSSGAGSGSDAPSRDGTTPPPPPPGAGAASVVGALAGDKVDKPASSRVGEPARLRTGSSAPRDGASPAPAAAKGSALSSGHRDSQAVVQLPKVAAVAAPLESDDTELARSISEFKPQILFVNSRDKTKKRVVIEFKLKGSMSKDTYTVKAIAQVEDGKHLISKGASGYTQMDLQGFSSEAKINAVGFKTPSLWATCKDSVCKKIEVAIRMTPKKSEQAMVVRKEVSSN